VFWIPFERAFTFFRCKGLSFAPEKLVLQGFIWNTNFGLTNFNFHSLSSFITRQLEKPENAVQASRPIIPSFSFIYGLNNSSGV